MYKGRRETNDTILLGEQVVGFVFVLCISGKYLFGKCITSILILSIYKGHKIAC
jgi:hypothetical protein